MEGWIKLHRQSKGHWLYPSGREFTEYEAWLDLLLEVNHKPKKVRVKNKLLVCERGQTIRSIKQWGERWSWSKPKVHRFLELLKKDNMIVTVSETVTTRITICKYDDYQSKESESETEMKRIGNASVTQVKRIGNASVTTPYPNKNVKNIKNDKNVKKEYPREEKKSDLEITKKTDPLPAPEIKDPFPSQLTKFLEGPTAPKFFWDAFDTLIQVANKKNLFIDFESLENGKTNIEKAVRLFNLIKSHQKIPGDGSGLVQAVSDFMENLPEWYLDKFDLPLVVSKFDRIVNEINSKNKKDEKRKPDPRFDDRKSKFEGASKRRGTVKFT